LEFRVIWEIEIEADSPEEAAQLARTIQLTPDMSATLFDVWAHVAGKMHRIDLIEQPDRLDREELVNVRAGIRLAQSGRCVDQTTRDIASAMLIFLDRDDRMFKRVHSRRLEWRSPSRGWS
jgi:hypothetical protein